MSKPTIKALLFDFDNTLTDFHQASEAAFSDLLLHLGIVEQKDDYAHYSRINAGVWRRFERGEIDTDGIRHLRFAEYFEARGTEIEDPFRANAYYLERIITHTTAYTGATDLLENLTHLEYKSIVTNGLREVQRKRIEKLGWTDRFDHITVSDEIGVAKPSADYFDHAYGLVPDHISREETLMIGDSLNSDIKGGKAYGLQTCWIRTDRHQKSAHADHHVTGVQELRKLLEELC